MPLLSRFAAAIAGPYIAQLELPIVSLMQGSPETAREFYRGRFKLAGHDVRLETTWDLSRLNGPPAWQREFHGLAWLSHLAADGRELHRAFARALCEQLLSERRMRVAPQDQIDIRARRLIALVTHARMLTQGATDTFCEDFFRFLGREWRLLHNRGKSADQRLNVAIACAYAVTGLAGLGMLRESAFASLENELDQQFFPDGGHISRNPARVVEILLDLIPLRRALWLGHRAIPPMLNAAIERMTPMVRFFSHGDGGLAAFQGAGGPMSSEVRAILEADTAQGNPLAQAPHTGYCRLSYNGALAIADTGATAQCASPLAFEFSDGPSRVVVNCGKPVHANPGWAAATADTAAHSTLGLAHKAAGGRRGWLARRADRADDSGAAQAKLSVTSDGSILRGWQDAHARTHNVIHERDLYLSANGTDLRGEDRIRPSADGPIAAERFNIRFHLHPAVKATLSKDGESVLLLLPNRSGWRFSARGAQPMLEESVYLFGQSHPRQSLQIVLTGNTASHDRINWAFKRIDKRTIAAGETGATGDLPF